jgi:hypothetical protein
VFDDDQYSQLVYQYLDKKTLTLVVKDVEGKVDLNGFVKRKFSLATDLSAIASGKNAKARKIPVGISLANTVVVFERAEGSAINLAGKSKGYIIPYLTSK